MSHPYRPQSRFPYRPARLSAPAPAPMGLGLDPTGYSRGSFGPRLDYAVPHYAAGYPGLQGYTYEEVNNMFWEKGSELIAYQNCVTPEDVARLVEIMLRPASFLPSSVRTFIQKALQKLLEKYKGTLVSLIGKGRANMINFLNNALKEALGEVMGGVLSTGLEFAADELGQYIDKTAEGLNNEFAARAAEIARCVTLGPSVIPDVRADLTEPAYVPTTPLTARPYQFTTSYQPPATGGGLAKILPIAAVGAAALLFLK